MKVDFCAISVLALLADPVLGKRLGGLRRKAQVRASCRHYSAL